MNSMAVIGVVYGIDYRLLDSLYTPSTLYDPSVHRSIRILAARHLDPSNLVELVGMRRPVPAPGHFSQSKFQIAQALPYRTFYRACFLHGEIDDADRHRCWLLHRRSRHRRAGDCSGSSSMHQRRPPCPPLPPTALRYPGIFCRLFCCYCSRGSTFLCKVEAIELLLLGHSGREKRRRPCQGGDIVCPIVDSLAVPDLGKHGAVARRR